MRSSNAAGSLCLQRRSAELRSLPGVKRNLAVAALLAVLGAVHMSGWLDPDLLPPYHFAGYVSVAEDASNQLLRHGEMPTWNPKWFAGTTQYMSSLKERLMLPWVLLFGGLELNTDFLDRVERTLSRISVSSPTSGVWSATAWKRRWPTTNEA